VRVQLPPWAPFPASVAQSRGRRLKPGVSVSARLTGSTLLRLCSPAAETAASKSAQRGCESHRRHQFNTSTHPLLKTKHDIEEKCLLSLDRERRTLWRRTSCVIALEHPVQRGWMRCYFLTEAAQQRSDAKILEAILKEINVIRYHWRRSFAPTKRNRRSQIQQLHQPLKRIKPWRRRQIDIPREWKNYFLIEPVFRDRTWKHTWRFRWPRLFELRVVPRLVHKLPVCDPAADSRLSEIKAILADPQREGKLTKLLGRRHWRCSDNRQKKLDRLAEKRLRAVVAGDLEAEKAAHSRCCLFCLRFFAPVAQCIERRASNAEVEGGNPSGSAHSSRNVNRTSEPGLLLRSHAVRLRVIRCAIAQAFGANEIVPPSCGMRSMSSAFRHFHKPTNANASSSRSFKSVLAGASPAVGAILQAHVVQSAETRRRERRQCGCNSRCEHHFSVQSLDSEAAGF
jgi:hypothetical protein